MKLSKYQREAIRREFALSPREIDAVDFLFQGISTNQGVADALGVTVGTAKGMFTRIFLKTGSVDKPTLILRCFDVMLSRTPTLILEALRNEGPDPHESDPRPK